MNEIDVYNKLTEIFRDIFDDDSIEINSETSAADIEDWDSLEHINLISAVEKTFKMRFSMKQVSTMKNVGEMVSIILNASKK
ncbi:MAG: acyl carrier protein [Clostridiales bacterium]|jgi:acyl carrier protein|nr:acyl carrier protein [Clostridiales bacterium]